MDYDEQLKIIWKEKRKKFEEHVIKMKNDEVNILMKKYSYLAKPTYCAATRIVRFIKDKYLKKCINDEEINQIPGLYRFRVKFTNHHLINYSEKDIKKNMISSYRKAQIAIRKRKNKETKFWYCFDIRNIYHIRHEPICLYDEIYYLQPEDHQQLENIWRKINGETNYSIIFLGNMDYYKTLYIDKYINEKTRELQNDSDCEEVNSASINVKKNSELYKKITLKYFMKHGYTIKHKI